MGGRGSSGGKRTSGGGNKNRQSETHIRIEKDDINEFISKNNPVDFYGVSSPEKVTVNGAEFERVGEKPIKTSDDKGNTVYQHMYRSVLPHISTNQKLLMDIAVVKTGKKRAKYSFLTKGGMNYQKTRLY